MSKDAKRKRSNSLVDLCKKSEEKLAKDVNETKPCPTGTVTRTTLDIQNDMERVTTRLDRLQASIDHLLDLCLQEGQNEYSEDDK